MLASPAYKVMVSIGLDGWSVRCAGSVCRRTRRGQGCQVCTSLQSSGRMPAGTPVTPSLGSLARIARATATETR